MQLQAPRLTVGVHVMDITMWGLARVGRLGEQAKQIAAPPLSRRAKPSNTHSNCVGGSNGCDLQHCTIYVVAAARLRQIRR